MSRRTFLEAIDKGDVDAVRAELSDAAVAGKLKINSPASRYEMRTPLTLALLRGDVEIVRLLLEAGANPNKSDGDYEIPIFVALSHPDCLRLLLAAGADFRYEAEDYITPLMCAVAWPESVRILLDAGADPAAMSRDAETALYFAACEGYQESVEILSARMPPESAEEQRDWGERERQRRMQPDDGRQAARNLRVAIAMGTPESVRELAGSISLEAPDGEDSPLIVAISSGSVEAVEILLARGADPNAIHANGVRAIVLAVDADRVDIARQLIQAGANLDSRLGSFYTDGRSARERILEKGSAEMKALLSRT